MQLTRSRKLAWSAFIVVDILLALVLVWLFLLRSERDETVELRELGTTVYPQSRVIAPFQLSGHSGDPFTQADLDGRWSLIFFGFSHCPDVCPLTMLELARFYQRLEADGGHELPRVIMVTVDPARDTPAALGAYVSGFHEDFIGLTGDPDELNALAAQLYVVTSGPPAHAGHEAEAPAEANFNHSGHISVINPRGELHAVMRLPHFADRVMSAYQRLLAGWN